MNFEYQADITEQVHFGVRSYECGPDGRASLQTICNYLQETAWLGAKKNNIDLQGPEDAERGWALIGLHLEMKRYPIWGEELMISTWPSGKRRLLAYRDFVLQDHSGVRLGRATSAWVVFDLRKRRLQRLPNWFDRRMPANCSRVLEDDFEISPPDLEKVDYACRFHVRLSDLDTQQHVNNVQYIVWALEAAHRFFRQGMQVSDMEIRFLSESKFGDIVLSEMQATSPNVSLHRVLRESDNTALMRARCNWSPSPD